jgi:hypothetical protein
MGKKSILNIQALSRGCLSFTWVEVLLRVSKQSHYPGDHCTRANYPSCETMKENEILEWASWPGNFCDEG